MALSPLFSNAALYSAAGQRSALATIALDKGAGNVDDLQSIVDDLAKEEAALARKQQEATQLIATLQAKQLEMASLEKDYLARYTKAEKELGQAQLRAAEAARRKRRPRRRRNGNANKPRPLPARPPQREPRAGPEQPRPQQPRPPQSLVVPEEPRRQRHRVTPGLSPPSPVALASPSPPPTNKSASRTSRSKDHQKLVSTVRDSRNGCGGVLACRYRTRVGVSSRRRPTCLRIRCSLATSSSITRRSVTSVSTSAAAR